jgi:hypothetical protein
MTSATSAGDALFTLRRTELSDCPALANLVSARSESVFGRYNLVSVVEKAILSVVASDAQTGAPVGFAAFYDSPDIPGVPQSRYYSFASP